MLTCDCVGWAGLSALVHPSPPLSLLPSSRLPRDEERLQLLQVGGEGTIPPPILPSPSFLQDEEFLQLLQVVGEGTIPVPSISSPQFPWDEEFLKLRQVGGKGNPHWSQSPPPPPISHPILINCICSVCRNGGGIEHTPWCYTMDPLVRWQHCHIEKCGKWIKIPIWGGK